MIEGISHVPVVQFFFFLKNGHKKESNIHSVKKPIYLVFENRF